MRREWLAEFAKRKTAPKDAPSFIATSLVTDAESIQKAFYDGHGLAAEWLGVGGPLGGRDKVRDLIAKASLARAQHIALVVILAAIEDRTGVQTWRKPGWEARYLSALESGGYNLSPVEQLARGAKTKPESSPTAKPESRSTGKPSNEPTAEAPTAAPAPKAKAEPKGTTAA